MLTLLCWRSDIVRVRALSSMIFVQRTLIYNCIYLLNTIHCYHNNAMLNIYVMYRWPLSNTV